MITTKDGKVSEQMSVLRMRLEAKVAPPGIIVITSAAQGDGKSLVASGVAESFASAGYRVAFVDASDANLTVQAKSNEVRSRESSGAADIFRRAVAEECPSLVSLAFANETKQIPRVSDRACPAEDQHRRAAESRERLTSYAAKCRSSDHVRCRRSNRILCTALRRRRQHLAAVGQSRDRVPAADLSRRSELHFDERARLDVTNAATWTPLDDLKIIASTVPAVLFSRGAHSP